MKGLGKGKIIGLITIILTMVISLTVIVAVLLVKGFGDMNFDFDFNFGNEKEVIIERPEQVLNEDSNNVFKYVIEDQSNKEVNPSLYPYYDNKKELYGYMNENGEIIIEAEFTDAKFYSDGLARVKNNQYESGYIDENGEVVIEFQSGCNDDFYKGVTIKSEGRSQYLIDKAGNRVSEEYKDLYRRTGGYTTDGLFSRKIITSEGNEIKVSKDCGRFEEINGNVIYNNSRAYIANKDSENILDKSYSYISTYEKGTFVTAKWEDDRRALKVIDIYGYDVEFKENYKLIEDLDVNEVKDILIFIDISTSEYVTTDRAGNILGRFNGAEYDEVEVLNSAIKVTKDDKTGVLNPRGENIIPLEVCNIYQNAGGTLEKSVEEESVFFTPKGKVITKGKSLYPEVNGNFYVLRNDDTYSVYNNNGDCIKENISKEFSIDVYNDLLLISKGYGEDMERMYYKSNGEILEFNK